MKFNRTILVLWSVVLLLVGIFIAFYFRVLSETHIEYPAVEKGDFQLSHINFNTHTVAKLKGKVAFYPDTLITPNTIATPNNDYAPRYISISNKWNKYIQKRGWSTGHGYGTYRFTLNLPEAGSYALKIMDVRSACTVFINGSEIGSAGKVGTRKETMEPSCYQSEFYFHVDQQQADVVIQASNFHHRKGGILGTALIGKAGGIAMYKHKMIAVEVAIFGSLFILFLYHMILYAYRKRDKSILYFSLLCLSMLFRLGYTGEKVFLELFYFMDYSLSLRVEYLALMAIPTFTFLFIQKMFPLEVPNWLVKGLVVSCIAFSGVILFTSSTTFSYLPTVFIYVFAFTSAYLLGLIGLAVIRKREYAIAILLGFVVYFALAVHDAIHYSHIIQSTYLLPFGLFVMSISQAYVLASKTSSAYVEIENLSDELTIHSNNLEQLVAIRTQEIAVQKIELEQKAKELKKTNDKLVELDSYKRDMTGMMIHDLKNPLHNILGFAELSMTDNDTSEYIYSSGWEMLNLIQNILDVDQYESADFELNKELVNVRMLFNTAYENARYVLDAKKMQFDNTIPDSLQVSLDTMVIGRVIHNILSNAAKYGGCHTEVQVSSKEYEANGRNFIRITMYNSGAPIPEEVIPKIFTKYIKHESKDTSHSYSSGIGLAFCKMAIEAHGGQIGVISGKDKGVEFWFTLPL